MENKGVRLEKKSFMLSFFFIFLMMVAVYILTLVIPGGQYPRVPDAEGNMIIDMAGGYTEVQGGIPFWKWLASPILVLTAPGSATLIMVIFFLLMVGGVFNALTERGIIRCMLHKIVHRYARTRYLLMAVLIFFFMFMGAFIGSFEEVIALVPIVVTMAYALGWDRETGLGMSMMAVCCGFASGVSNPFTVGIAQTLAGLPIMSGIGFRAVNFVLIYALVLGFVALRARKIAREPRRLSGEDMKVDEKTDRGFRVYATVMVTGLALILISGFVPGLSDYTMVILLVTFLGAGVSGLLVSGMGAKAMLRSFWEGAVAIAPSIILILMASSIRYVMEEGQIMDMLLKYAVNAAGGMSRSVLILFIYLICIVINFFVPSGSAEAILLIPIIVPLGQMFGISAQLCIVAYAFGDGFSNILYPTNPALLVGLGLADMGYGKWVKFSLPFQLLNLLLTGGMLLVGLAIGYA